MSQQGIVSFLLEISAGTSRQNALAAISGGVSCMLFTPIASILGGYGCVRCSKYLDIENFEEYSVLARECFVDDPCSIRHYWEYVHKNCQAGSLSMQDYLAENVTYCHNLSDDNSTN